MSKSSTSLTRNSWWWGSLAFILFLIVGIGTVMLQKELRRSQENRGQAAGVNGIVEVGHDTSMVLAKNQSVVLLGINTHDSMIRDVTLNFDVLIPYTATAAATLDPSPLVQVTSPGLYKVSSNVGLIATPISSTNQIGWRVNVTAEAVVHLNGFSTGQSTVSFLRFDVRLPETDGQLVIKFNQSTSAAFLLNNGNYIDGGTDILKNIPDISLEIYNEDCQYTYTNWSSCTNGLHTRTFTTAGTECSSPHSAMVTQSCSAQPPQCMYLYSDWKACANGWQERSYSEVGVGMSGDDPKIYNCAWYNPEVLKPLSQECQMPVVDSAPTDGFSTYTYETCWNDRSEGGSTYVIWDKNTYSGATKIDVSTTSDFKGYATKTVTGATTNLDNNYLATDATNFRTYTDGKNAQWIFWPGYTYYFRMYYGANQHTGVISYFVPKCAGTGVSYKQCNESCSANKDCSSNLSCVSGVCRRADNAESSICATPPDKGLQRACNDYCSDSSECGGGLTCWWNRCRAPKNLDNTSCQAPKKTTYVYSGDGYAAPGKGAVVYAGSTDAAPASTTPESSCNESCKSNRECAANLRCFQGSCRLSANVTNTSCLTVKEAQAATLSATIQEPKEEIPVIEEPIVEEQVSGFTALAQWLVGRIGFLLVGLLVAVAILMVWPLLRPRVQEPTKLSMSSTPSTYRSYPSPNTDTTPSSTMVQKPINQMMTPPRQEP